jgi:hypothetical protein
VRENVFVSRSAPGLLRKSLGVATTVGLLLGATGPALPRASARAAANPAAEPRSSVGIDKTDDLGGKPLQPGDAFTYTLDGHCSGLTVDCVNFTVTDVLPAGLEVTSLPQSTTTRTVTFTQTTRKLTIVYKQTLQNPAGETGLRAGQASSVEVGMRLPADTQLKDVGRARGPGRSGPARPGASAAPRLTRGTQSSGAPGERRCRPGPRSVRGRACVSHLPSSPAPAGSQRFVADL